MVKIGQTIDDLGKRLRGLQAMMPTRLELVALGRGHRLERMLHGCFEALRAHGEWFSPGVLDLLGWHLGEYEAGRLCLMCSYRDRPPAEIMETGAQSAGLTAGCACGLGADCGFVDPSSLGDRSAECAHQWEGHLWDSGAVYCPHCGDLRP